MFTYMSILYICVTNMKNRHICNYMIGICRMHVHTHTCPACMPALPRLILLSSSAPQPSPPTAARGSCRHLRHTASFVSPLEGEGPVLHCASFLAPATWAPTNARKSMLHSASLLPPSLLSPDLRLQPSSPCWPLSSMARGALRCRMIRACWFCFVLHAPCVCSLWIHSTWTVSGSPFPSLSLGVEDRGVPNCGPLV